MPIDEIPLFTQLYEVTFVPENATVLLYVPWHFTWSEIVLTTGKGLTTTFTDKSRELTQEVSPVTSSLTLSSL